MRRRVPVHPGWGIAALRVAMGLVLLLHGYQKFAGGLAAVSAYFAQMSIPLPGVTGPFIAALELVGGALLVLGLATRWVGLLFALEFVVATFWVALPRAGVTRSGLEIMLLAGGLLLFLNGGGKAALDRT